MSRPYGILIYMKKLLLILCFTVSLFYCVTARALAASEFTTTFSSLYNIAASGETTVTHTITLKNNLAHIYATSYSIATSGDKLTHITGSDEHGSLPLTSNTQNGVTTIQLTIPNPAIGKDQIKTLTISYLTDDVVEQIGDTSTINIPRLARANEAESYTRIVRIEGVQDKPSLITPQPNKTEPDGDYTIYTFSGHLSDSLSLLFGKSVTYQLNLTYELKNKDLSSADSELALPSDTSYQHILLANLTPPPKDIHLDGDGNWLARYNLNGQANLEVSATLYATIYPQPTLFDPSGTTFEKTLHSKFWDTTSGVVTNLASSLKTPENIYHYLTDNFTYNYGGISSGAGRLGALSALSTPGGVLCTEFTDSFVSLARALAVPSREINGYGFTKNNSLQPQNTTTDILHSWPEYYDANHKIWQAIDPTWGNTTGGVDYFHKLDFSHIAFVRHGLEDSYPLPAGAYKNNPTDQSVQVKVAGTIPPELSQSTTKDGIVYNTGNVALINDQVGYLPPYGSYKLKVSNSLSFYDKIRGICAKLLSKFLQLLPASLSPSTS